MTQRIGSLIFSFDEFLKDEQTGDAKTEELLCVECQRHMTRYDGRLKKEQVGVSIFTPCDCPQGGSEHRATATRIATCIYARSQNHSETHFQKVGDGSVLRWRNGGFHIQIYDYVPKEGDVILMDYDAPRYDDHIIECLKGFGLRIGHNVGGVARKLLAIEKEAIPS